MPPLKQMPFEGRLRLLPCAECAIVSWLNGVLSIDLRQVSIDLNAVKQAALTGDIPCTADWVRWWTTPKVS